MPSAPASTSPLAAQTTGLSIAVKVRNRVGKRARPAYLVIGARLSANASRLPPEEKTRGCEDVSTMILTRESDAARRSSKVS
ncbi:Uncharacterised protein [Mycobacterium tuberculosis]|nr:Uncharacterised protein [Mycobacterium tuberculosis]